ncbi:hypothetical protein NKOR_07455 [Candidatus Nitrosopumilus koreensis AR1]|uniref:Uncharacterized protein n=1 Tax=Candidatus Nitrosopumilus koreensis AR1 TaxID=1229908 RepID=K0B8C8_9ARCH|nr:MULTISPECIES: hypothetical protein [Nitrosopumilus]AFS81352.1 hypothetical protein NKOR_07455 [Candidatus Nitrosopumilus koreensis AR1]
MEIKYNGNLTYYKYTLIKKWDKNFKNNKRRNLKFVNEVLTLFCFNNELTSWEAAKKISKKNFESINKNEKKIKRLFVGRMDNGTKYEGLLQNEIIINIKNKKNNKYRISLFGLLYCLTYLKLTNKEIDNIAKMHQKLLPKIFSRWDEMKEKGDECYRLRLLSRGLLLDRFDMINDRKFPTMEMLFYLHMKFLKYSEMCHEKDLAEEISYWFYITYFYSKRSYSIQEKNNFKKILNKNPSINTWFKKFLFETKKYFKKSNTILVKNEWV